MSIYKKKAIAQSGLSIVESTKPVKISRGKWDVADTFITTTFTKNLGDINTDLKTVTADQVANGYTFNQAEETKFVTEIDFKQTSGVLSGGINRQIAARADFVFLSQLKKPLRVALTKQILIAGRYGVGWKQLRVLIQEIQNDTTLNDVDKGLACQLFNLSLQQNCAPTIVNSVTLLPYNGITAAEVNAIIDAIQVGVIKKLGSEGGSTFSTLSQKEKDDILLAVRTPFFTLKKMYGLATYMLMNKIGSLTGVNQASWLPHNDQFSQGELQMGQGLRNEKIFWISDRESYMFGNTIPPNVQVIIPVITYLPFFIGEGGQTTSELLKIMYQFSILSVFMQITYQNDAKSDKAMDSKFKFSGMISHAMSQCGIFRQAANDLEEKGYVAILEVLKWDKYKEIDLDQFIMSQAERDCAMDQIVGKQAPAIGINHDILYQEGRRQGREIGNEERIISFIKRQNKLLDDEHKYDEPEFMQPQNEEV